MSRDAALPGLAEPSGLSYRGVKAGPALSHRNGFKILHTLERRIARVETTLSVMNNWISRCRRHLATALLFPAASLLLLLGATCGATLATTSRTIPTLQTERSCLANWPLSTHPRHTYVFTTSSLQETAQL